MQVQDSVAFVTGANRGLGRAFAQALLAGGARRVYAAARNPGAIDLPGVVPVQLDVTDPAQIAAAAARADDVSLLINNAGIARGQRLLGDESVAALRAELETNTIGPLLVSRAFAPILARRGGGAIINVLSVASWISRPTLATYGVSKAAAWSVTNGLRNELRAQGTQVLALHAGFIDTDLAASVQAPKSAPADVVAIALRALIEGHDEVLADDVSRAVKASLSTARAAYLVAP